MLFGRQLRTFLIMGCPGSGKGTLSKMVTESFNLATISSGDLLRHHIELGDEIGLKVRSTLAAGGLVEDKLMIKLMLGEMDRHATTHTMLDGFPRTVKQAEELDHHLHDMNRPLDMVLSLDVPEEIILGRIDNRWIHAPSGRTYNYEFNPPKVHGLDDETGEPLTKRPDDTREVFYERLRQYHKVTEPLLEYYKSRKVLESFHGETSKQLFPLLYAKMSPLFAQR